MFKFISEKNNLQKTGLFILLIFFSKIFFFHFFLLILVLHAKSFPKMYNTMGFEKIEHMKKSVKLALRKISEKMDFWLSEPKKEVLKLIFEKSKNTVGTALIFSFIWYINRSWIRSESLPTSWLKKKNFSRFHLKPVLSKWNYP